MGEPVTGSCRCGTVQLTIAAPQPLAHYCCHCHDCQKTTGSAFAEQVVVLSHLLTVDGETIDFVQPRPSGGVTTHRICPNCHTRVASTNSERQGITIVKGGALDDADLDTPVAHMWIKRKRAWVTLAEDAMVFDETPDTAGFTALLMPRLFAAK